MHKQGVEPRKGLHASTDANIFNDIQISKNSLLY